jgi:hypothetical protein
VKLKEKMKTMNLNSQYEIDINNYKKKLEEKIEEKQSKLKTIQELNNIVKNKEEENKEMPLNVIKINERISSQNKQLEDFENILVEKQKEL